MKALTAISIAIGVLAGSLANAATPQFHVEKDARVVDLGLAPQGEVRQVTLSLAVKNLAALEAYAASTVDPSSANYKKFLTPAQFAATYGQDATAIAQVVNFLQASGLKVTKVYASNLLISASGTNAQLGAVFGNPIHSFQSMGQTYEAPSSAGVVPTQLVGLVKSVHGLNARPLSHSNAVRTPHSAADVQASPAADANATTPGLYTTADLAKQYNITPLYSAGITGAGKTIGIATLAGYTQSDVFAYWKNVGLKVDPNRITDVLVDNGPPGGAAADGADETTLDVEQSGGVAPGANIRVYMAPNTDAGFIDMFAAAINDNIVDTLSVSWGAAEVFYDQGSMDAFHAVFLQAAAQGIPVIASAGDSGAYDINRNYAYPGCTTLLSVDFPAADSAVLAAGGTTLPVTLNFRAGGSVTVPTERAWGWDYLRDWATKTYSQEWYYQNVFPEGGGGGVSVNYARPAYQANLTGVANSAPAQTLLCSAAALGTTGGYQNLISMPSNYAGRNLPDVSLNADPESGYRVYYKGAYTNSYGGTSFVAPQLNGIFTLIASGKGGRVGMPAPQLYSAFKTMGYGVGSPFRPITAGTNEYYQSKANFNPATGLGALDVANLARVLGVKL